jgi:hypothetical protein
MNIPIILMSGTTFLYENIIEIPDDIPYGEFLNILKGIFQGIITHGPWEEISHYIDYEEVFNPSYLLIYLYPNIFNTYYLRMLQGIYSVFHTRALWPRKPAIVTDSRVREHPIEDILGMARDRLFIKQAKKLRQKNAMKFPLTIYVFRPGFQHLKKFSYAYEHNDTFLNILKGLPENLEHPLIKSWLIPYIDDQPCGLTKKNPFFI